MKSRQLGRAVLLLFLLGVVALVWGHYQLQLPTLRSSETVFIPLILVVPIACGVIIGVSTRTWVGELERTSARQLVWWRLTHALALCTIGIVFLVPAMDSGYSSYGATAALRNILGYTGLAYLCASLAGGGLSWLLPLVYALPVPLFGVNEYGEVASWAWPLQPAGSYVSWAWALAFIIIGVGAFTGHSPRRTAVLNEDEQ